MVKVMMVKIENNKECFVQLWRRLERTRQMLGGQYKRFCIRGSVRWPPMILSGRYATIPL